MKGLNGFIDAAQDLITNFLIPIGFALCLLYFFWGMAKYIRNSGDEKAAEEGRRIMVWGEVGLFVVFSIWGIIWFIRGELKIRNIEGIEKAPIESVDSRFIPTEM